MTLEAAGHMGMLIVCALAGGLLSWLQHITKKILRPGDSTCASTCAANGPSLGIGFRRGEY